MAKTRIYYDKSGTIVRVEHRMDEKYTQENVPAEEDIKDASWIVTDPAEFRDLEWKDLVVKSKKLKPRA